MIKIIYFILFAIFYNQKLYYNKKKINTFFKFQVI